VADAERSAVMLDLPAVRRRVMELRDVQPA
jgi:hypothetical protein